MEKASPAEFQLPVRIRLRDNARARFVITAASSAEAERRHQLMLKVVERLGNSPERARARDLLERIAKAGSAQTAEQVAELAEKVAEGEFASARQALPSADMTFERFAELWTSGDLHEIYKDHVVKKKTSATDAGRLKILNPVIGHVKLKEFTLAHAQKAMASLPERAKSSAARRHYAQVLSKVLTYAVFPACLLEANPLPRGFLPKLSKSRARAYLYPDEDARLLGNSEVPLCDRLFFGFLAREGLRVDEASSANMDSVDLKRGVFRLDNNKTDDARSWVLDPSVLKVLQWWCANERKGARGADPLFVNEAGRRRSSSTAAAELRAGLATSGVLADRPELNERSERRLRIRAHDLRATFVTLSLAGGRSESWIADRTGHRSSMMINRYKRVARTHEEAELGQLRLFHEALPEYRVADETKMPGGSTPATNGSDNSDPSAKNTQGGPEGGPATEPEKSFAIANPACLMPLWPLPGSNRDVFRQRILNPPRLPFRQGAFSLSFDAFDIISTRACLAFRRILWPTPYFFWGLVRLVGLAASQFAPVPPLGGPPRTPARLLVLGATKWRPTPPRPNLAPVVLNSTLARRIGDARSERAPREAKTPNASLVQLALGKCSTWVSPRRPK